MGRKRRQVNRELPKYVYRKRDGLIYREYMGLVGGKRQYRPDVWLCPADAPQSAFWRAYERATGIPSDTLNWLLGKYEESDKFKALKPRTRKDYEAYRMLICKKKLADGSGFGEAPLDTITIRTIRGYLDTYPAKIAANRHIQYLKAAWGWAKQYHDIPDNPCMGVTLHPQNARTRYVTKKEFAAFHATTTGYVPVFMEFAYICRGRWGEIANLKAADITTEGVVLRRGKGSKGEITAWTPRLEAAVQSAQALHVSAPSPISGAYLIHNKIGRPISQNAFQTAWGRAMRKWEAQGNERFTFHDLKAAGYSDQKVQDAGHKSAKMHDTYNRKLRVVEPAE